MKFPNDCIYSGTLIHTRLKPKFHKFFYNIFYFFINIDNLDDLKKKYIFFSYNNFNIFSIYDKDHGYRNKKKIKEWIKEILKKININEKKTKVFLLSMPRIFGYAFNPLSIFFCYDLNGTLRSVIYEVKNTFGEQHCYVFKTNKNSKRDNKMFSHSCKKNFHVSPFWGMDGIYNFKILNPRNRFYSSIIMKKKGKKIFQAILNCRYVKLGYKNLILILFKFPFLTIKVVLAIYFEALKIFIFKNANYFKKPVLKSKLSIINK
ncbi:MAG: hypothetical protein CFH26_00721 [Alphaproteobacteria bacterium MarineAlpha6_Bin4]|nr:MAG: hypothetical protein CFH26_00721 [Alphaproteobacteria bacterium MarineAlpha6_Bin4]|tara:strand:+ start:12258 stop:13043 length:786 start_codon:yes stop_codon:yes gene_type:complete